MTVSTAALIALLSVVAALTAFGFGSLSRDPLRYFAKRASSPGAEVPTRTQEARE